MEILTVKVVDTVVIGAELRGLIILDEDGKTQRPCWLLYPRYAHYIYKNDYIDLLVAYELDEKRGYVVLGVEQVNGVIRVPASEIDDSQHPGAIAALKQFGERINFVK